MRDSVYRIGMTGIGMISDLFAIRHRVIFCLHSVAVSGSDPLSHGPMSITSDFLEALILDCKARSIAIVSLAEALRRVAEDDRFPFVALTFDDGYRDNYEVAYPIFARHNTPFTIFVTTGLVDRALPMWWDVVERLVASRASLETPLGRLAMTSPVQKDAAAARLGSLFRSKIAAEQIGLCADLVAANHFPDEGYDRALDWTMVRAMASSGLVEIGCHTVHHPVLADLDATQTQAEIAGSRDRLRHAAGVEARYMAYPFGQPHEVGTLASDAARKAGFSAAFTTQSCVIGRGDLSRPYELPRIMLARKAQSTRIARAYLSGLPQLRREFAARAPAGRMAPVSEGAVDHAL